MRRILGRRLFGAMMTCGLMVAGPALAGGSGMPWEGPLQQVVQSITGPGHDQTSRNIASRANRCAGWDRRSAFPL